MRKKKTLVRTQTRGLGNADAGAQSATRQPPTLSTNRYAAMVQELTHHYKIAVRKWQSRMAGFAYELLYADGTIKRLITAPRPRSPVSAAIFLHEVAHHAIGFQRYAPRCLEEFYAWQWTFRQMESRGIPVTAAVRRHYERSMRHYARLHRKASPHHPVPQDLHAFFQHSN